MVPSISTATTRTAPISPLQGAAWAAWNASFGSETPETYRMVSRALYQQDMHERIALLFARSDEQNRQLDALFGHHLRNVAPRA